MWTRWMATHKSSDVETNPGLTTTHKQVWICDIWHKQIHGMKHICEASLQNGPYVARKINRVYQSHRTHQCLFF